MTYSLQDGRLPIALTSTVGYMQAVCESKQSPLDWLSPKDLEKAIIRGPRPSALGLYSMLPITWSHSYTVSTGLSRPGVIDPFSTVDREHSTALVWRIKCYTTNPLQYSQRHTTMLAIEVSYTVEHVVDKCQAKIGRP